ncbi:MAG: hypothetical protein IJK52_00940, partial [Oscillospiraceae bacterium]|nr:hypothetical protein [Oscillospiraceae bacterium]
SEDPEPEEPQSVSEDPEPDEPQSVSEDPEPEEPQSVSEEPEPEEPQTVSEDPEPEEPQSVSEEPELEEPQTVSEDPEPEEPQSVSEDPAPEEPQPVSEDPEPESEEVEIIVDLAFGDDMGYAEAYRDFGLWDAPEALRDALDVAQFASAWGEAGRAALKIKGAAGTTRRQNINGLTIEGFALDEENSTLDELIRQNTEEVMFSLSYLRVYEDRQSDGTSPEWTWSDELWTE